MHEVFAPSVIGLGEHHVWREERMKRRGLMQYGIGLLQRLQIGCDVQRILPSHPKRRHGRAQGFAFPANACCQQRHHLLLGVLRHPGDARGKLSPHIPLCRLAHWDGRALERTIGQEPAIRPSRRMALHAHGYAVCDVASLLSVPARGRCCCTLWLRAGARDYQKEAPRHSRTRVHHVHSVWKTNVTMN